MSSPSGTSSVAPPGTARSSPPEDLGSLDPGASPTSGTARIIAIANQKGGVGKSTTAVSLGAALAELGLRVLVVDLDPQGNASTGLGIRHEARDATVYDVIVADAKVADAVVPTPLPNLHALPSTIDLAGAEIELVSQFSRESRLKKALEAVREGAYDYILLDCPPSLGLLTINALTAAEELIVPIQCEYYALEGLGQLLRNVNLVQQNINPGLRVTGIVLTMFDPRTKLSEQVVDEVRRFFGDLVYDVIIPRTVRLSEAPGYGQPITVYDPKSKGAESYRELARQVADRPMPTTPMPAYDQLPTVVVPPVESTVRPDAPVEARAETTEPAQAAPGGASEKASLPEPPTQGPVQTEPSRAERPAVGEIPAVGEGAMSDAAPPRRSPPPPVASAPPSPPSAEPAGARAHSQREPAARTPTAAPSSPPPAAAREWEEPSPGPASTVRPPRERPEPGHLPERRVVVIDEQAEAEITTTPTTSPTAAPDAAEPPDEASSAIGATLADDRPAGRKRRWRLFRKGGE